MGDSDEHILELPWPQDKEAIEQAFAEFDEKLKRLAGAIESAHAAPVPAQPVEQANPTSTTPATEPDSVKPDIEADEEDADRTSENEIVQKAQPDTSVKPVEEAEPGADGHTPKEATQDLPKSQESLDQPATEQQEDTTLPEEEAAELLEALDEKTSKRVKVLRRLMPHIKDVRQLINMAKKQ